MVAQTLGTCEFGRVYSANINGSTKALGALNTKT